MKYLVSFIAFMLVFYAASAVAKTTTTHKVVHTQIVTQQLMVYEKASLDSKVIAKMSPWHIWRRLSPFHRKGNWLKVGFKDTGDVGWISLKQYRGLLQKLYKPKVRTVLVKTKIDSDKKDSEEIEAYIDGKKVSKKRAQKILKKVKYQQKRHMRRMRRMRRRLDRIFNKLMADFDDFADLAPLPLPISWPTIPVIEPIIVINQSDS